MDTTNTTVELPHRSVWKHKRKPITLVINHVAWTLNDVQVLTNDREHLKYLSIKGFLRDYEPTGKFETFDGRTVDAPDEV